MEKALLEYYLDQGLSLPQIGTLVGRDPSTVGYWVKKHGLTANGKAKYAPRGGLTREQLEPLVEQHLTLNQIAEELRVSASTVRHWLDKYGLRTARADWRADDGSPKPTRIERVCLHHGTTEFFLQNRGAYRCRKCASEAVSKWRRKVKRILVEEAGGACILCNYDRCPAAMHFHHLDPTQKEFSISREGVTRSLAEAREEVKKCVLLCANCHAEVEADFVSLKEVLPTGLPNEGANLRAA